MLKEELEKELSIYVLDRPDISIAIRKVNTNVYKNGIPIMWIYYRSNDIRISIKPGSAQHLEYEALYKEDLVFQRASANPYGKGEFSFFVARDNIMSVINRLVNCTTLPSEEFMAEYNKQANPNMRGNIVDPKIRELFSPKTVDIKRDNTSPEKMVYDKKQQESDHRIERKLDSLINTISILYSDQKQIEEPKVQEEKVVDKRLHIEPMKIDSPIIFVKGKASITSLVFNLKLVTKGTGTVAERQRVFFVNSAGERISNTQEFELLAEEEYNFRAELQSSASEEERVFLVIQEINAKEDEVRQMIEFPVKIAFSADFGL